MNQRETKEVLKARMRLKELLDYKNQTVKDKTPKELWFEITTALDLLSDACTEMDSEKATS